MKLTPSTMRRIADERIGIAIRERFRPPSSVLSEEDIERYSHRDLGQRHVSELHAEIALAGAALRNLPKSETISREWWRARAAALIAEVRHRKYVA